MEKAKIESEHCKQFLRAYDPTSRFTDNQITQQNPPEPDFWLNFDGQIIGIEHTRLHRNREKEDLVIHDKYIREVMQKAHELFYARISLPINVNVVFKNTFGTSAKKPVFVSKNDVERLGLYIANFLILHLNEIRSSPTNDIIFEPVDLLNRELRGFPEKILRISVYRTSMLLSSWSTNGGVVVPDIIESEELISSIDGKNRKPKLYKKKYDKLWLLVVEDSSTMATYFDFDNFLANQKVFETAFDNIFILRASEDKIYELKTYKLL